MRAAGERAARGDERGGSRGHPSAGS